VGSSAAAPHRAARPPSSWPRKRAGRPPNSGKRGEKRSREARSTFLYPTRQVDCRRVYTANRGRGGLGKKGGRGGLASGRGGGSKKGIKKDAGGDPAVGSQVYHCELPPRAQADRVVRRKRRGKRDEGQRERWMEGRGKHKILENKVPGTPPSATRLPDILDSPLSSGRCAPGNRNKLAVLNKDCQQEEKERIPPSHSLSSSGEVCGTATRPHDLARRRRKGVQQKKTQRAREGRGTLKKTTKLLIQRRGRFTPQKKGCGKGKAGPRP